MKDALVRFGVAMEQGLLNDLDALVEARGSTRSELLRDLVRAEVGKTRVKRGTKAVGALTLVYDHHVRDLGERLNEFQHALGERVRATLHIHLDHDHCLEVIVMRGRSEEIERAAEKLLATRGVKQGGIEMVAVGDSAPPHGSPGHVHDHDHDPHQHHHHHPHPSPAKAKKKKRAS